MMTHMANFARYFLMGSLIVLALASQPLWVHLRHPYAVWLWCDMAALC